jgi:hypothetical protein
VCHRRTSGLDGFAADAAPLKTFLNFREARGSAFLAASLISSTFAKSPEIE